MTDAWFDVPRGRRLDEKAQEVAFNVRVLPKADEKSLDVAERTWDPPAKASDFEPAGKGWIGKDGTRYLRVRGNPLAGYDQANPVAAYFVADGHIVFLRADAPGQETTQTLGIVGSREAGPRDSQMKPLEQVLAENAIRGGGA